MKIALVHDYLNTWGGAEEVLYALHQIWPEAPIYTIYSKAGKDKSNLISQKFARAKIIQSWFGKLPYCHKLISPLRFLIPLIWSSFDFSNYDLIITSASWAITKGLAKGKTKEICYCHTPPRYLYGYETSRDWQKNPLIKAYALVVNHFIRLYDFKQAQKVNWFVANSREVQKRIEKFYRRDSTIIYPPASLREALQADPPQNYFLTGGRLEKSKNFDLIIKACNRLKVPLKIFGSGLQEVYLKSIAGPTIEFLGQVNDQKIEELFARCRAFICAAVDEDFGITPVIAMAAGRPVVAFRGGGYLETVVEGKTGEFFDQPTVDSLVSELQNFAPPAKPSRRREASLWRSAVATHGNVAKYKPEDCLAQAKKFSKERFIEEIKKFVEKHG